jgi:hypothetical protein
LWDHEGQDSWMSMGDLMRERVKLAGGREGRAGTQPDAGAGLTPRKSSRNDYSSSRGSDGGGGGGEGTVDMRSSRTVNSSTTSSNSSSFQQFHIQDHLHHMGPVHNITSSNSGSSKTQQPESSRLRATKGQESVDDISSSSSSGLCPLQPASVQLPNPQAAASSSSSSSGSSRGTSCCESSCSYYYEVPPHVAQLTKISAQQCAVFALGEVVRGVTLTANGSAVRGAAGQGVMLETLIHRAVWLTGQ